MALTADVKVLLPGGVEFTLPSNDTGTINLGLTDEFLEYLRENFGDEETVST